MSSPTILVYAVLLFFYMQSYCSRMFSPTVFVCAVLLFSAIPSPSLHPALQAPVFIIFLFLPFSLIISKMYK